MLRAARFDIEAGVPPKTYAAGRRCPTCAAVISIYNESDYCSLHLPEPSHVDMLRHLFGDSGRKRRLNDDKTSKQCRECGKTYPLTTEFWYVNKRNSHEPHRAKQWSAYCKPCSVRLSVERRRNERAKKGD